MSLTNNAILAPFPAVKEPEVKAPSITIEPSKDDPTVGEDFMLTCQVGASGDYRPGGGLFVRWAKVDGYVAPNVRNGGNSIR